MGWSMGWSMGWWWGKDSGNDWHGYSIQWWMEGARAKERLVYPASLKRDLFNWVSQPSDSIMIYICPLIEALWNGRTHVRYEMENPMIIFIHGPKCSTGQNPLNHWHQPEPSIPLKKHQDFHLIQLYYVYCIFSWTHKPHNWRFHKNLLHFCHCWCGLEHGYHNIQVTRYAVIVP